MRREVLESGLDDLFANHLTSEKFLKQIERDQKQTRPQVSMERLESQLQSLVNKRQRILDSYFEGLINQTERDLRLADVDREKRIVSELIARETPQHIEAKSLAKVFQVFVRFKRLNRDQKRRLLTSMAPEIMVADYQIKGLYFGMEKTRTDKDS
jgi:hypothetical protein